MLVLSTTFVSGELFVLYDDNVYTAEKIFNPVMFGNVFHEERSYGPLQINITEKGFFPQKIVIKKGQEVVWKNKRERLPVLLMGMREISSMRQSLKPEESFSYIFDKPGKYFYTDGIVIGYSGEVVVQY